MLTNEETKALVLNRIRRSRETWAETKGIIEGGHAGSGQNVPSNWEIGYVTTL